MRGTLALSIMGIIGPGIIPAYAGNTTQRVTGLDSVRDHPRVCGEHLGLRTERKLKPGSSPRMRGTRAVSKFDTLQSGIIPAYAGNTCERHCPASRYRDHPRVCGEHILDVFAVVLFRGSSPRMRGTPHRQSVFRHGAGIIPAYAGNTLRD